MDLLYQSTADGVQVALGSRSDTDSWTIQSFFSEFVLTPDQNADCAAVNTDDIISLPNSNSFVDLNGDCVPDLVLTRQKGSPADMADGTKQVETYYELYSQVFLDGQSKYCKSGQNGQLVDPKTDKKSTRTGSAPMPFLEIADFNRDGMLDMAFTTETGVLNILLNQFSSPGHKATNLCNDVGNTADLKQGGIFPAYPFTADKEGVIQESIHATPGGEGTDLKIEFNGLADSMPVTATQVGVPGRLRVQDID